MRIAAFGGFAIWCATVLAVTAGAQQPAKKEPPNISGAWERYGFNLGQPTSDGQRRDGTIPPRSEQPVVKPAYQKDYQDRLSAVRDANAKGSPLASNYVDCLGDGMPLMMQAMFPIEFLQSPGQVTVIEEAFNQVRRIKLDKPQKKIEDVEPGFYGHSVGHWEGDTLLVDTIGIKESIRYNNLPHSDQMRIREKIHLVSPTVLWDEVTIEDPVVLEKPFTVYYSYRRMPDYTLLEYICEDNREYKDANGVQQIHVGDTGRK
jgi:hypothetical protein